MIRGVCFDMDGTLLDTERPASGLLQKAANLQGFSLTEEQWKSMIGRSTTVTKANLRRWFDGQLDPDRFFVDWCDLMLAYIHQEGMPFKPHARELLISLKARGVRLALCTSNAPRVVNEYLRIAGWEDAFDAVITGNMVPNSKPAPDIFLLGAERLGLSPRECAGVEDSFNGVKSVRAAGLYSIMIPDLLPYTDDFAPYVDAVLPSLCELEETLGRLP